MPNGKLTLTLRPGPTTDGQLQDPHTCSYYLTNQQPEAERLFIIKSLTGEFNLDPNRALVIIPNPQFDPQLAPGAVDNMPSTGSSPTSSTLTPTAR